MHKTILSYIILLLFFTNWVEKAAANVTMGQFTQSDSIASAIVARCMAGWFTEELIRERNGEIESHIVERGETWQSIARGCGVDEALVKALNPFESDCMSGMEIRIPRFPEVSKNFVVDQVSQEKLRRGLAKEEEGNFKEAIKIYSEIIKTTPNLDARYLRGRAYYRNKKLKESVEDFRYVATHDKDNRFPDARDIYNQVSEEWSQYKEQRASKWFSFGLGLLDIGLKVASDYMAYKNGSSNVSSFLSGNGGYGYSGGISQSYSPTGVGGTGTDYYHNGIQWPESLDPSKYFTQDAMKVEISYDMYGNPMYSMPGIANAMTRMQQDFNWDMMSSGNLTSGTALSNTLLSQLNLQNNVVAQSAYGLSIPSYGMVNEESAASSESVSDPYARSSEMTGHAKSKKCIHCDGTGWIRRTQSAVATLGQHLPKRKCPNCGYEWSPEIEVHSCDRCKYCDAGKL